jgi:hypothetical protein
VEWYRVQLRAPRRGWESLFGWAPSEIAGEATLREVEVACPDAELDVSFLSLMEPQRRLECAEGRELTLRGWVHDVPVQPIFRGNPPWLAEESSLQLAAVTGPAVEGGTLSIHVDPAQGIDLPRETRLELTGHFDDPASRDCQREPEEEGFQDEEPAEQILWCRQQFVVTAARVAPGP